jgi:general secretion pathway protein A
MHLDHFALDAEPFSLTPDPEFLYLSPVHAEALAALTVGVRGRRGLLAMTGEVGTGKTTLLYSLMRELGDGMRTAYVANTTVTFEELLRLVLADFGAPTEQRDRVDLLLALNAVLMRCAEERTTALLIIDEAHNLDVATLENIRLLSNVETFRDKLLQIVLVGQPELDSKLQQPNLRQLAERVAVHCRLTPLGTFESRAYLDYRLLKAGGSSKLFAREARELLLEAAAGIPRRINILCHNALLFAYGRDEAQVGRAAAESAIRERAALLPLPGAAGAPHRRTVVGAAAIAAALLAAVAVGWFGRQGLPAPAAPVAERPAAPPAAPALDELPATVAAVDVRPAAVAPAPPVAVAPAPVVAPPAAAAPPPPPAETDAAAAVEVRTMQVPAGATLAELARQIYGAADQDTIRRIQSANPQVIDPNLILAGDRLRFPAAEAGKETTHE